MEAAVVNILAAIILIVKEALPRLITAEMDTVETRAAVVVATTDPHPILPPLNIVAPEIKPK